MERFITMESEGSILNNRLLRNIVFVSLFLISGLLCYNFFFSSPAISALVKETTKDDAIRVANYFSSKLLDEKNVLFEHRFKNGILLNDIQRLKSNFDLMNIKIYSSSGEVLFSEKVEEVGEKNDNRYFKEIVSRGKVYSKVVPKNSKSLEGKPVTLDVQEVYVPLMESDKFLGAFEIYYNITERKKNLDKLLFKSSIILLTLAFGLFSAIFFILFKEKVAIKESKKLETERLRKERLQGVLEMAGAACHELNQPLQVISGNCELLLKDFPYDNDVKNKLMKMEKNIDKLSSITTKIMNITRYETKNYLDGFKIIDIDKASTDVAD